MLNRKLAKKMQISYSGSEVEICSHAVTWRRVKEKRKRVLGKRFSFCSQALDETPIMKASPSYIRMKILQGIRQLSMFPIFVKCIPKHFLGVDPFDTICREQYNIRIKDSCYGAAEFPDFLAYLQDRDQLVSDSLQVGAVLRQFYQAQTAPFQSHALCAHPATITEEGRRYISQWQDHEFWGKLDLRHPTCLGKKILRQADFVC